MPLISIITGKVDFNDLTWTIGRNLDVSIKYGTFITSIINFLIIAFSIFLIFRYVNKLNKKFEEKAEEINCKIEERMERLNKKLGKKSIFNKMRMRKLAKLEKEERPKATTKRCTFCFTEIDIRATRCPNCTSVLEEIIIAEGEVEETT